MAEEKDIRTSNRRPFATGSKPGPDELDHHLESKGLYRKHIARDASSLFRVISEQIFDIQNYHEKVRQDLSSFIELNIRDYAQEVDKNIYNYCNQLRRNRTYGTLFDLKVLARMYKRNVVLYEPTKNFQTSERYFVQNDDYDYPPMRIFYSEPDKHFDIIFTLEYTEQLAESQGIVYEMLYKDVFKLPDVTYAVERMLHDPEGVTTLIITDDTAKYTNAAGEIIPFDSADDTECVLKDPRTCHFHNQDDFEEVIEEQKDLVTIINRSDEPGRLKIYKPIDGFLHSKDRSCVRQLLEEKITPFPYKVAKALDRSIYRNTEFELWSENRKDQRLKWLDSNGLPIREHDDLFMHADKKTTHTQITREALDELLNLNLNRHSDLKKRPFQFGFDALTHLDSLKMPPVLQQMEPTYTVYPVQYTNSYKKFNLQGRRRGGGFHQNFGPHRFDNNYHHHHPQPNPNNFGGQELHPRENFFQEQQDPAQPQPQQPVYVDGNYQFVPYDQVSPSNGAYQAPNGAHYIAVQPSPYQLQNAVPMQNLIPNNNFSIPPPPIPIIQQPQSIVGPIAPPIPNESTATTNNLIRENELTSNINQTQQESVDPSGNDLPINDLPTMRFFFNLGVRYFAQHNEAVRNRLEGVVNQLENLNVNCANSETNGNELSVKNEVPPPVPTNTPVSSKPSQQPQQQNAAGNGKFPGHSASNNRFQNGNHHNTRQFNNRNNNYHRDSNWRENRGRQNGNQSNGFTRRESGIQFNSNVKNLHKIDVDSKPVSTSLQPLASQGTAQQLAVQAPTAQTNSAQVSPVISGGSSSTGAVQATPGISPIGTAQQDGNFQAEQGTWQQQPQQVAVPQYYQYPPQNYISQPPAQAPLYYYNEHGEIMSYQAPAPQPHPVYYSYPPQAAPMYYQAAQVHPNQMYDHDSGHADASIQNYSSYPVYYAQPPPVYYPPTPATAASHIMTAPVFPVANQLTPTQTTATPNENASNGVENQQMPEIAAETNKFEQLPSSNDDHKLLANDVVQT